MKALTRVTLINGGVVNSPRKFDTVVVMVAQMARADPGSVFQLEHINMHGKLKPVAVLAGTIMRVDEI
jgi:hypothetical protein